MLSKEKEEAIRALASQAVPIKEICRILKISRNAVRRVTRGIESKPRPESGQPWSLVKAVFKQCKGNVVRVREVLADEHHCDMAYSSLTRMVRKIGLREKESPRAGQYSFGPGEEMQLDTSPHRLTMNGRQITAQCAALVLAYSRVVVVRYYPAFTRFEAKVFLSEALAFLAGACKRCTIDNTSVMVAGGSGPGATIAPEMESFAEMLGFRFVPHRVGDPDRKGRVERIFSYTENNFLAGRSFSDWQDLNRQAEQWCRQTADTRFMKALGMSPQEAFIMEKPHLMALPAYLPPVYQTQHRRVDIEGFVALDTNRYSVPERFVGQTVEVQKHWEVVKIYRGRLLIAEHRRVIGERLRRITAPGHYSSLPPRKTGGPSAEEKALSGRSEALDQYLALIKKRNPTGGKLTRLLHLQRTYPAEAFLPAVQQALAYGLFDLNRLEKIILKNVATDFFNLD